MPIRTHYDNLHISADADAETVKQAYRRLSKQYHPDLNPDPDAHRIMQLINQAYEVLSDPERRAEHDRWIAEQQVRQKVAEVRITVQRQPAAAPAAASTPPQPAAAAAPTKQQKRLTAALLAVAVVMAGALLAWQLSLFWSGSNDETAQDDASAVAGSLKTRPLMPNRSSSPNWPRFPPRARTISAPPPPPTVLRGRKLQAISAAIRSFPSRAATGFSLTISAILPTFSPS